MVSSIDFKGYVTICSVTLKSLKDIFISVEIKNNVLILFKIILLML